MLILIYYLHLAYQWFLAESFLLYDFLCSDCWRGCKFCGICICPCCSRYTSWCIKYYCEVTVFILFRLFQNLLEIMYAHIWFLYVFFTVFGLCSAVLAHFILHERLHQLGILGCVMCIAGSIIIVIHSPQEIPITSVQEIWSLATQPG